MVILAANMVILAEHTGAKKGGGVLRGNIVWKSEKCGADWTCSRQLVRTAEGMTLRDSALRREKRNAARRMRTHKSESHRKCLRH